MSRVFLISANTAVEPFPVYPLGMAAVGAALLAEGHAVRQFDPLVHGAGADALRAALRESAPDVVGLSVRNIDNVDSFSGESAWQLAEVRERIGWVREETAAPVVLGGAGFSILPEEILAFTGGDYGVVGLGEGPLSRLVGALASGRPAQTIWRATPADLAKAVSRPAHDPGIAEHYARASGLLGLSSKRGCPHACVYCTYPAIEGGGFRPKEPREVADEAERLHREFGAETLFFTDSVFNDAGGHHLAVAEELCRRELGLRWCAFFRPADLTHGAVALLQRSGLCAAELGTDAASDATLAGLRKDFSFSDVEEATRAFGAHRIPCAHYVIFGGPGETEATVGEGLANLERLEGAVVFAFSGIRLLPGTPLHRRAIAEGVVPAGRSLLHPAFYFSPEVEPEAMNRRIEEAFRGRPTRLFPPPEAQRRARLLREVGVKGLLWDRLALAEARRRERA